MQARAAAAWAGGRRRPALTSREESNPCPGGLGTEQSDIGEADKEEGRAHDAGGERVEGRRRKGGEGSSGE